MLKFLHKKLKKGCVRSSYGNLRNSSFPVRKYVDTKLLHSVETSIFFMEASPKQKKNSQLFVLSNHLKYFRENNTQFDKLRR